MSDENIFSEVDEELRREQMRNLWRRFGPWVIGAAVVIVLAVAINEGWAWYKNSKAAAESDAFYNAAELAENGDYEAAHTALEEVAAGGGGYAYLARFRQATALAQEGKTDEAIAAYDALANESDQSRLRELALLDAAFLLADKGDVAGVKARVEGLNVSGNPLRMLAAEAIGLAQYASGDADAARATFEEAISDQTGDGQTSGRMQIYLAQLIAQGAADPNPEAPEAADSAASDAASTENEAAPATDAAPADQPAEQPAQ